MEPALVARLGAGEVVVLDGGLATHLEAGGHDLSGPLWSARLLAERPEAVRAAHADFAAAGAEVLLTASYQLSARGLAAAGHDPAREADLLAHAVAVAREAATKAASPAPTVAGALGPYGAARADGSEYTGGYGVAVEVLRDFHAPRVEALVAAGADALVVETVPSAGEVAAVAPLLAGTDRPAWVTVTVAGDGTRTPEGQPIEEALAPAAEIDEVVAVGVNCAPPELVPAALDRLAPLALPLVAKPNAGARWDPAHQTWRRPRQRVDARPWVAAGARLVGGCCGTSPADLAALAATLPPRPGLQAGAGG